MILKSEGLSEIVCGAALFWSMEEGTKGRGSANLVQAADGEVGREYFDHRKPQVHLGCSQCLVRSLFEGFAFLLSPTFFDGMLSRAGEAKVPIFA